MNNKFLKSRIARAVICVSSAGALLAAGIGIGYRMQPKTEPYAQIGYASNPTYENMVGAAAWQMSAEAHALMMQGFHVAQGNVDDMVALADTNQQGYRWVEEGGQRWIFPLITLRCCWEMI